MNFILNAVVRSVYILRIIHQDIEFFNALNIEGVKYADKKGEKL